MASPYSTGQVEVVVTDDLNGKLAQTMDHNVTEKSPGDTVTMHASDAALLKRSGMVEDELVVENTIPDQADGTGAYSFTVPDDTFSGGRDNVLSATKGDGTALPGWLSFDADTGEFSGTAVVSVTAIKVTATSRGGQTVSDTFTLTIT